MVAPDRHAPDQAGYRSARAVDLRTPQFRARRPRRDLQAADRPGDAQLHRQLHRQQRQGQLGLRQQARQLHQDPDRHRLRPAPGRSSPDQGEERQQGQAEQDRFRTVQEGTGPLHGRVRLGTLRRAGREPRASGQAVRGPGQESRVLLDHGLQPARARCLGERPDVQRASADRQDLRAGQWPVLADWPAFGLRNRSRDWYLCASTTGRPCGVQETAPRFLGKGLATAGWSAAGQEGFPRRIAEPHAQGRQAELLLGQHQQQHAGGSERQRRDVPGLA